MRISPMDPDFIRKASYATHDLYANTGKTIKAADAQYQDYSFFKAQYIFLARYLEVTGKLPAAEKVEEVQHINDVDQFVLAASPADSPLRTFDATRVQLEFTGSHDHGKVTPGILLAVAEYMRLNHGIGQPREWSGDAADIMDAAMSLRKKQSREKKNRARAEKIVALLDEVPASQYATTIQQFLDNEDVETEE